MQTLLIILVILAVALPIANWLRVKQQERLLGALRLLAERRGALLKPGSLLANPALIEQHAGVDVRLSSMPGGGTAFPRGDMTFAMFRVEPAPDHWLRLQTRETSMQQAGERALRPGAVALGDPQFDRDLVLWASNRGWISRILSADLRWRLLSAPGPLAADFKEGTFVLSLPGILVDASELSWLLETAGVFAERLGTPDAA